MDEKLIEKWLDNNVINEDQANIMRKDIDASKSAKRSSKIITAVSTIGAVLLGLAAITFMAANWDVIPDFVKILLFTLITVASFYFGYILKYEKKSYPLVGSSLVFLSGLMVGATIFLTAQTYNLTVFSYIGVLIWLIFVLPLVYILKDRPIGYLASALFLALIAVYAWDVERALIAVLILAAGIVLVQVGRLHSLWKDYENIGRIGKVVGNSTILFIVFLLTFSEIADWLAEIFPTSYGLEDLIETGVIELLALAVIALTLAIVFFVKTDTNWKKRPELLAELALILIFVCFMLVPAAGIFIYVFNIYFITYIVLLMRLGYQTSDASTVNKALYWFGLYIFTRYIEWFWDLLPQSMFFFVGGVLLIGGGVYLEKKRRSIAKTLQ